ncbi:threonine ammonia-lyase IlvA [Raineyella sp. LH-20]|uniref:threonine ammonia-lyase IlvA n=1 Tax=Raineyella sp. LH-20 TaxID=3081204 RepID=UPI0029531714|nr:threonine ammonia-lyase IlvA [Raineyella sp. LH-20]WOP17486.1 threonine ammonia-lyase IlvA [Raineyella sp. LH-20]
MEIPPTFQWNGIRVGADAVEEASARLSGVVRRTPLQRNERLSNRTGADVWVKREDLQPVRSYKLRGAYYLISGLSEAERAAGVICASAGNHGQGVAFACRALGIRGRIVCPTGTPRQKRDRMVEIGGDMIDVVLRGRTYDEAAAYAAAEAERTGATIVPAFDDPRTVIGQGTVAQEIVEQLGSAPDILLVPVGGGGLLGGILTWMRERAPHTRVIAVEPTGAASLAAALAAGGPVDLEHLDTFVDGTAVRRVGDCTYAVAALRRPLTVNVPEGAVCSEMLEMYQVDGIIAEPAGALATAALRTSVMVGQDQTVVAIVSGGNNDVSRYAEVIERSLVWEGRKHYFLVNFSQEPGALRAFLDEVLGPNDDIVLFEYVKRNDRELGPALVGIELSEPTDLAALLARMDASPIECERLTANSPAYRFLVAGG